MRWLRQINRRWLFLIPLILLIAALGFVIWAATPQGEVMEPALAALESDDAVTVSTD